MTDQWDLPPVPSLGRLVAALQRLGMHDPSMPALPSIVRSADVLAHINAASLLLASNAQGQAQLDNHQVALNHINADTAAARAAMPGDPTGQRALLMSIQMQRLVWVYENVLKLASTDGEPNPVADLISGTLTGLVQLLAGWRARYMLVGEIDGVTLFHDGLTRLAAAWDGYRTEVTGEQPPEQPAG